MGRRVLLIVLAVMACGCSNRQKASFIRSNDEICTEVGLATLPTLNALFPLPNGSPDATAADQLLPGYVSAYKTALAKREALSPPASDRARFDEHYRLYTKALDDLAALAQTNTGASGDFADRFNAVTREFGPLDKFEQDYGFFECGSEPGPNAGRTKASS